MSCFSLFFCFLSETFADINTIKKLPRFLIPEPSTKPKEASATVPPTPSIFLTKQFPHYYYWACPFNTIRQLHSPEACSGSTCSGPHVLAFSTTKRTSVGGTSGSAHGIARLRSVSTTPTLRYHGTTSPRGVNTVQRFTGDIVYFLRARR